MPSAPTLRWFGLLTAVVGSTLGLTAKFLADEHRDFSEPVEARQFDSWLGSWEVVSPFGVPQGRNKIELVASGRGLAEEWSSGGQACNADGRRLNALEFRQAPVAAILDR